MNLPSEPFSTGTSPLHRTDTRIKLISALALTLALALTTNPLAAALGMGLGLILTVTARLDGRALLARMLAANLFIIFLAAMLPLTYPGHPILALGPLAVSKEGLSLAGLIVLKANAIILVLTALAATSPLPMLGRAMQRLRVPAKLCHLLLFTYRYVFVIGQEYLRLRRAAKLRCFTPRTTLHTYRTYAHLFAMTLVRSVNRAERVRQAMILRGFTGRFHALEARPLALSDGLWLTALTACAAALAALDILNKGTA